MSNAVNRILTEQLGGRHAETFIGKPGEIFYDFESGALRIGDGVTPGGHSITESSPMESEFIGDWVYFERPDNSPDVVDIIADNLIIARNPQNNNGSIYNMGEDSGGQVSTPYGTQWNTDGWEDFSDVENRYYGNFTDVISGGGWASVKHNWVMHDTQNNKYYAIRFLTWDAGHNNATGAFSWIRRQINTGIYFTREDYNNENDALANGDPIDDGLTITRGAGQAIFNVAESLQGVFTQFDKTTNYTSVTWNVDQTVTVVDPDSNMLTALNAMQVGDTVSIDNGSGPSSQTVTEVYNPITGKFTIDYTYGSPVDCSFISLDFPTLLPKETDYNSDESPVGTLWNYEGFDDLSNLKSRQFVKFDDLWAGEQLGQRITGKELVMWDTINDKYYAIKFTRWQQAGNVGGPDYPGFSYTRRLIDANKLTAGLKFNDGTIQTTGYSTKIAGTLVQSPKLASTTQDRYITPGDIGRVIYLYAGTSSTDLRIPDGGTADFPVGSTITIINRTGGNIYVTKENNNESGTIYGAGTSDSYNSWVVPDNGGGNIVTLMKIETGMNSFFNDWMISGSNLVINN